MNQRLLCWSGMMLALSATSSGCVPTGNSSQTSQEEERSEAGISTEAPRKVYIARASSTNTAALSAQFVGSYDVQRGCLVFVSSDKVYLPVFAPGSTIQVYSDHLVVDGQRIALRQIMTRGGGEAGPDFERILAESIPSACTGKTLLRSS